LLNRNHCSFSLNNDGEELRLYRIEDGRPRWCDRVTLPPLESGISYGRLQDGASSWIEFDAPTPNQSNQTSGTASENAFMVHAFPNPAHASVQFSEPLYNFSLFDLSGRLIHAAENITILDTSELPEGVYLIKCHRGQKRMVIVH